MDALELLSGMTEWRQQHPKATLREMEVELDERLAQLRAKMLEDMLAASTVADWSAEATPRCPECGQPMRKSGAATRHLITLGGKQLELKRQYARCPACGAGFFPSGPGAGAAAGPVHTASG